jgi:Bardet-Biedl syndrome 7 protein
VCAIKACDLGYDDIHDVVVGRDDGTIEIYSYDDKSAVPTLRFETKIAESITGLDAGFISNP